MEFDEEDAIFELELDSQTSGSSQPDELWSGSSAPTSTQSSPELKAALVSALHYDYGYQVDSISKSGASSPPASQSVPGTFKISSAIGPIVKGANRRLSEQSSSNEILQFKSRTPQQMPSQPRRLSSNLLLSPVLKAKKGSSGTGSPHLFTRVSRSATLSRHETTEFVAPLALPPSRLEAAVTLEHAFSKNLKNKNSPSASRHIDRDLAFSAYKSECKPSGAACGKPECPSHLHNATETSDSKQRFVSLVMSRRASAPLVQSSKRRDSLELTSSGEKRGRSRESRPRTVSRDSSNHVTFVQPPVASSSETRSESAHLLGQRNDAPICIHPDICARRSHVVFPLTPMTSTVLSPSQSVSKDKRSMSEENVQRSIESASKVKTPRYWFARASPAQREQQRQALVGGADLPSEISNINLADASYDSPAIRSRRTSPPAYKRSNTGDSAILSSSSGSSASNGLDDPILELSSVAEERKSRDTTIKFDQFSAKESQEAPRGRSRLRATMGNVERSKSPHRELKARSHSRR